MRYTAVPNADPARGVWGEVGYNELNICMSETETITSNARVLGADPLVEDGIGEEDMLTLVLPYIHSAREGVTYLGAILEKYGTYEMNGIGFQDTNEIWWLETIGGHHWIAKRVPDDAVVIMPNQFGMDNFDFDDAYGKKKEHLCSADLKKFVEDNRLYTGKEGVFNPRLAFGSRTDADHIYNTPRAWYMARYFNERTYKWDGENADFTPESNDLPWSLIPEKKVTVEDVRYVLGSYYQGTMYNPYGNSNYAGKYRSIGIPNTDVCGILQIRGYMPDAIKGVHWYSLGGSCHTACFPFYSRVDVLPDYISKTTASVDTDYMYWQSRLIAALTDAQYKTAILFDERYTNTVFVKGRQLLHEYDEKIIAGGDVKLLEEANKKITDMVKKESDKVLGEVLKNASEHMKTRYHRGDN